jgi:glycerol kinase
LPVLAIDQGTTGTRALVSESAGTGRIICVFEHRQHYPQPGWVEHDPEELVRNIQQCVDLGLKQFPDISAIGIDNQGESCLGWDADTKQAISPIIVWQDSRTQAAIESLQSDGLGKVVLELSGLACPHWDRRAAGLWIGLSLDTTAMDMMQSMLEGIAFRATEVIDAMNKFTPIADIVSIDGGVSNNPYFLSIPVRPAWPKYQGTAIF